jgi:hypothetical protein
MRQHLLCPQDEMNESYEQLMVHVVAPLMQFVEVM